MAEIRLNIEDRYLKTFLDFLKTLGYTSVLEVKYPLKNGAKHQLAETGDNPKIPPSEKYTDLIEDKLDLKQLMKEQNYESPNRKRFAKLAENLDIQEPIEELLASLSK